MNGIPANDSAVADSAYILNLLSLQKATTDALAETQNLSVVLPNLLAAICETLRWQVGEVWLVDNETQSLRCAATWCKPEHNPGAFVEESKRRTFSLGEGLPGRVWASAQPSWILDVTADANFPRFEFAKAEGLHSGIAFPIRAGGKVLGVVEFFNRELKSPDKYLLQLMDSIGCQIGQVIQRLEAIEFLRESRARKAAILETALDCIISMNHKGKVTEWNPAAEKTFGYSKEEAMGHELSDLIIPERLREAHRRGLGHYLNTGEGPVLGKRIEVSGIRKDQSEILVELAITHLKIDGPPMFTAYLRDITLRKKLEQNLVERVAEANRFISQLKDAEAKLQDAVQTRDEFLSIASHELKTPVTALQLQLELNKKKLNASDGVLSPERTLKLVDASLKQVHRLVSLIDALLDVSRIQVGKLEYDFQRVDLSALVSDILVRFKDLTAKCALTFSAPHPVFVLCDSLRMEQVVVNLLSNALKYGEMKPVFIDVRSTDSVAELEIRDSGMGIKKELHQKIFERFERAIPSLSISGLGLGLYIVKIIVDAHGGSVGVASEEGQGAAFKVTLPLAPAAAQNC